MAQVYRQEVFNVLLAQLLQERGVIAAPESIIRVTPAETSRMPDVIVTYSGLRTVIEGEIAYRPDCQRRAKNSARKRVEEGIAHIGVAIVYPTDLQEVDSFSRLKAVLAESQLFISIVTEADETDFVPGNVDYLERALRHAFEQLVRENVVAEAVAKLDGGIERFAQVLSTRAGAVERVARALGIYELTESESGSNED